MAVENDTDIHKAENPNLHAHIPFPALVHRSRRVKKPVDANGQAWTPKDAREHKIEIVGEELFIERQHMRVEDADAHAKALKDGWHATPLEADQALDAKTQAHRPIPHAPKTEPTKE